MGAHDPVKDKAGKNAEPPRWGLLAISALMAADILDLITRPMCCWRGNQSNTLN